jgi:hypothetical protein
LVRRIHLGVEKNFIPAKKAHPAFIVDDLAGLTSALTAAGFPISHDAPLEGYDRIFVHDRDQGLPGGRIVIAGPSRLTDMVACIITRTASNL